MNDNKRLVAAYERLMQRIDAALERIEVRESSALHDTINRVAEDSVHLGELTREEAGLLSAWIRRDLEDAGQFLAETGSDLRTWFRFDLELVEERLLEWFGRAADRSRLEFLAFEDTIERMSHYHAGEISGPGTLACEACGAQLEHHTTAVIPACPACGHKAFNRVISD